MISKELILSAEERVINSLFSLSVGNDTRDRIDPSIFVTVENEVIFKELKRLYDKEGVLDAIKILLNFKEQHVPGSKNGTITKENVAERFIHADADYIDDFQVDEAILFLQEQKADKLRFDIIKSINNSVQDVTLPTEELIKQLKDDVERLENGASTRYSKYFINDLEEIKDSYKKPITSIPTEFMFKHRGEYHNTARFILPSGGITIIGAPTNHGKSKMLQSLALDVIYLDPDAKVLYITYEENKKNVYAQFLNAYADKNLTRQNYRGTHGNATTIAEYLHDGSTKFMNGETINDFLYCEEKFNRDVYGKKLVVVKPDDNYINTLVGIIRNAVNTLNIKAVFVDYVQELSVEYWKTSALRSDELKEVMIQTDLIAQKYDIPIVMAAQLNRETADSPLSMGNQSIADSAWIERKASEILLLWSNQKKCFNDKDGKKQDKVNKELPDLSIGTSGKIYLTVTKSRYIPTGIEAIVDINGNTGRVHGNITDEERNGEEIETLNKIPF